MQARMKNPAMIAPGAMQALHALGSTTENCGVPSTTIELLHLRASQINGCSVCVDMHTRNLKKAGEADERLSAVAAWPMRRTSPMRNAPRWRSPRRPRG